MTIKDLLDEYAGAYKAWDNCNGSEEKCLLCKEDKQRMAEIISEVETLIRKETIEEITEYAKKEYLKIMGINHYTVYPDYEGLRMFLMEEYKLE